METAERIYKAQAAHGYRDIIPEDGGLLQYLAFGMLSLRAGERYEAQTGPYETALVILSGRITVESGHFRREHLGMRSDVFDGKGTAVYIPCGATYTVVTETGSQIAICKVKAEEQHEPFVIAPDEIVVHRRGKESWNREVHDIVADNADGRVSRMVLGETFSFPGQWSSYPPHKHDGEHEPEEPFFEEIYHYRVDPAQGFAVQLHYAKDPGIDQAYIVRDGDTFAIDKGYHPVAAAGGYRLYYLWFMAGDTGRTLVPYDDPDHSWLK